ncbi:transposase [Methylobacterium sp. J-026]|uniref:IS66-like element accessory protein TnpA n=1 Tax=Methylobacterium sp. J-026 TaxID=2836624 RepID=UPI001FBB5EE2|nr:transposase [Methylobacterium sp. J-026]MCJ2133985.1 transposase [Methylobacterium sp. J-026]
MLEDRVELPRRVRRLEVFTGVGSRRRWSDAECDRILAEATASGAVVSVVARRHGISSQHLFTWLRAARRSAALLPAALPLTFVPALVEDDIPDPAARRSRPRVLHRDILAAEIELDLAGVTVRIGADAREATITAVIRALTATV